MQIPEKLSLIGGSILLTSTLVFTLKSQASQILPKVNDGMAEIFKSDKDRQQKQQEQDFNNNFQQAQQKGWQTGTWGTARFYVDSHGNMNVGSGQLNDSFSKVVNAQKIKTINLSGSVQAPSDSSYLFANNNNSFIPLSQINGLSNLNTSNATRMDEMFFDDNSLNNLDLSHFDTHNVNSMMYMFDYNYSLNSLNLSNFDTHNVDDMKSMFYWDNLSNLDLSHFDTRNVYNMADMFDMDNIHQLSLGSNTKLQNNSNNYLDNTHLSGTYQNNGQTLNLDGNAHPGTWVKQ